MDVQEWREYYTGMVLRGNMKPEKEAEMVKNCGGQKRRPVSDPADPLKQVEPVDEAVKRIKDEILEMSSRDSLLKKADHIIAELRRVK